MGWRSMSGEREARGAVAAMGLPSQSAPRGARRSRGARPTAPPACGRSRRARGRSCVRCDFTVFSLISSRRAISLFGSPSTSSAEHLALARREQLGSGSGSARASRTVRAARGSSGDSPRAAARMPSATSSAVDVLEQIAARARLERAQDPRAVGERREHEHRRLRAARRACRRVASMPSSARHVEVHEHDVGLELGARARRPPRRRRPCRRARCRRSAGDQPPEAVADDAVVVGEQDADHRAGTSSSTVVPSPGLDSTDERAARLARRGPRAA